MTNFSPPHLSGAITVSPLLPIVLFGIIVSIALIVTFFLNYNWKHYGVNATQIFMVRFWYLGGFAILSGIMFLSALGYLAG